MVDLEREYSPSSRVGGTAEPFIAGYQARSAVVNDPLGLDEEAAAASSPQLLPCSSRHEVVVAWGDNETDSFKAQGRAYAAHLDAAGVPVSSFECATRHHFDIVDDLVDPDTPLGRATLGGST